MYRFQIVPAQGGGSPDPYPVQVTLDTTSCTAGVSAAGVGTDHVFRTFVTVSVGTPSVDKGTSELMIHPDPFSTETALRTDSVLQNATLTMYTAQGQPVRQMDHFTGQMLTLQPSGLYSLQLTENGQLRSVNRSVITVQKDHTRLVPRTALVFRQSGHAWFRCGERP